MSIINEMICTEVRFKFWNGKKTYTVEYSPALRTWYVFDEEMRSDCLAMFEVKKNIKSHSGIEQASYYLDKYFKSINSEFYTA